MASASKEKEVSSVPTEDGSIAEMQEEPEVLQKLRDTECSLLLERTLDSNTILHLVANSGHVQTVEMILSIQQCRELLTAKNSSGDLPLHVAANAGHLSIVEHFVNSSHQCQDLLMAKNSNDDLPIHVAANAGHLSIVKYLFFLSCKYPDLLTEKNPDSRSRRQQQKDLTSKLLREKNKERNTPLHLALIRKYEEVDVNVKSKYNEVAKFLIENDPIVIEYANNAGMSPCDMASKAQDPVLWKFMFDKFKEIGAEPTTQGAAIPVFQSDEQSTSTDSSTDTMLKGYRRNRKSKDKVTSMKGELYKAAVKLHNITRIQKLIEQDLENSALSDKTPELNTILHLAAASSDDDQFVEEILRIQICQQFVTEKNSSGDLPLHVAASAGNLHIVKLLVKWSNKQLQDHSTCRPEREKNIEGNTPLHLALIKKIQVDRNLTLKAKYNDVAGFLVRNDPQVSYFPNKEHKSPLYMAAEAGDAELVKLMINKVHLLPYGESIVHSAIYYLTTVINLQNGKSIVHTAICGSFTKKNSSFLCPPMCLNRHTDILDTVLKSLPDDILTMKDDKGMTPLFYAASIGYLDGVEILLKKPTKCCAYERDTDGYYPIHIASWKGHIKVVEKFLDVYPDMIELLTDAGQNILHLAAMNGKEKVVAYMLKKPDLKVEMLINNGDENGNTPLHLAAKKGHPKVVCILTWDKRVDLKALNNKGKRALDVVLSYRGKNNSFRERLTWEALRYVSGPRAPPRRNSRENPQSSKVEKTLSTDKYEERTDTLLLVATLVATVTFAAAFTMPGGYNGPGGMATFLEKPMFQVFVISNTIAMYSAITAVIALIWAKLGDHKLFIAAYKFGLPILGLAITMVSLAFMAGNYLVLRNVNWLAYLVLSIGSLFLFTLSIIFFPLFLPNSSPHPIIRYLLRYPFYLLIMFTRCDTDDREGE